MVLPYFFIGLFLSIFLPSFTSLGKVGFFFPSIVLALYKAPISYAYFLAFIGGFWMDTVASDYQHLGIFSLNYLLTCYLVEKKKKMLIHEGMMLYPLMTLIFSFLSSCLGIFLLSLLEKNSLSFLNIYRLGTQFILNALIDAVYATLLFYLPFVFKQLIPKKSRGFSLRRPL